MVVRGTGLWFHRCQPGNKQSDTPTQYCQTTSCAGSAIEVDCCPDRAEGVDDISIKSVHRPVNRTSRNGHAVLTCEVNAPVDDVWAVLADGWMYPEWVVGAARLRDTEGSWPAVGARIHHSVGVWPFLLDDHTEVLESDPGRELLLLARAWPFGEAQVRLQLNPTSGGTSISMQEDASAGSGKFVPQAIRQAVLVPRNVESLRRLALIVEGRHAES